LKKQPNYQMNQRITHRVNKPIIAKAPNSIWCVDLIDLAKYSGHKNFFKYVVVVVDTFSRKVWLEKMRTKGALQTARALRSVFQRAGIMPSVIMSDNGTEFKGEFAELCKDFAFFASSGVAYFLGRPLFFGFSSIFIWILSSFAGSAGLSFPDL
jgi:hypothetical protein